MKNLAAIRKSKRLTQAQLGDIVGLNQATISKIERDDGSYNYTAEVIHLIASALKVAPAELFGLPELQQRALNALNAITDPDERLAALIVLEAMSKKAEK